VYNVRNQGSGGINRATAAPTKARNSVAPPPQPSPPASVPTPEPLKEYINDRELAVLTNRSVNFYQKDRCEAKKTGRDPIIPFIRWGKRGILHKRADVIAKLESLTVGK
jgi:hypothetical protein